MTDPDPMPWLTRPLPDVVHTRLDETGLLCPLPIVHLGQLLRKTQPDECIEIIATDPGFFPDLLRWLRVRPHELVALRKEPMPSPDTRHKNLYKAWVCSRNGG